MIFILDMNLQFAHCTPYDFTTEYLSPKWQNPGNWMTQSHLPRTGRGVVEAVHEDVAMQYRIKPALSQELAGFSFSWFPVLSPYH